MTEDIRLLTAEHTTATWALTSLTFGYHNEPMPDGWSAVAPGRARWGALDLDGRLLGTAVDREQEHWFGGRLVPASGVASVAVAAAARGGGLGRRLLTRLIRGAHERGAVISTLFDSTPLPYRRLGWEEVGALVTRAVPTLALQGPRQPAGMRIRAAVAGDVPAIERIYRRVARDGCGMMERWWYGEPESFLAEWAGVTVVDGPEGIAGYATWDRGSGYDESARLHVGELIGLTPEATAALVSMLATWVPVASTVTVRQAEGDPLFLTTTAGSHARVERRQPWMLRLLDVAGAIAARGYPPYLTGTADLAVVDPECPWNTGNHRLVLADGNGRLEPGGRGSARFTPRGLALWYAGAATPLTLRRLGLLAGETHADEFLRAATAGPAPTLLDHF